MSGFVILLLLNLIYEPKNSSSEIKSSFRIVKMPADLKKADTPKPVRQLISSIDWRFTIWN